MEKMSTLNLQVDTVAMKKAEKVLSQLGMPMSTAINLFLDQIGSQGKIPFMVSLPEAPGTINADMMTDEELAQKLQRGFDDARAGRYRSANEVFTEFLESHGYETL